MRYLADNGADLNAKTTRGQTPADAAGRAEPEIQTFYTQLLQAHSADAAKDKPKVSPAS
jgi:hypothetical protein